MTFQVKIHGHRVEFPAMVQRIADRVAQNLEIIPENFPTNQNSAHGIHDYYQVINDKSHENPGTLGTKLKDFKEQSRDSVPPYQQSAVLEYTSGVFSYIYMYICHLVIYKCFVVTS